MKLIAVGIFFIFLPSLFNASLVNLGEQVYIYRDYYGVPHIYAESNKALFFGQGYVEAEDHLEQMLINYRMVEGRLSEIYGRDYLESDKLMRLLRVTEIVYEKYNDLSNYAKEAVEGFTEGINYYMETHPEDVPDWATPITPQLVVAWGKIIQLSRPLGRLFDDIKRGNITINLPIEIPNGNKGYGSNEWVVAGDKTVDGYVMLQSDPHLPWFGMNSWYEVHLVSPEYNVAGSTLWGIPGVIIGHNDRIAWALTANTPDIADAYIEKLNPSNHYKYLYDGRWLDIEVKKEYIDIKGEDPVKVSFFYTHHGPIFYTKGDIAISGKMSTWENIGMLDQILAYDRAKNLDDFINALSLRQMVKWNHVYGDIYGNVFYIWNAKVYHRNGNYDYNRPVDGSTSATEWRDIVALEDLPQELNPESRFFQNCNTAPWYVNPLTTIKKGDYPNYVCPGDTFTARGIRATQLLDPDWNLTVERMMNISFDTYSLYAEVLIPLLEYSYQHEYNNISDPNGIIPEAINVIKNWDYRAEKDSNEVALAKLWIEKMKSIGIDLLNPPKPEDLTVKEMQDALLLLMEASQTMLDLYGSISIPWGNIHVHSRGNFPLSGAGHILATLYQTHGGISNNGIMYCDSGSSYLMLTQLSNPIKSWSVFPLSESNHPNSKHYLDISKLYSEKKYKPAWFTKEEILNHLDPEEPNPVILTFPRENKPPYTPDITGEINGLKNKNYKYKVFTVDPEDDDIYYYIDWGDDSNSSWLGPYKSGEEIEIEHSWDQQGSYTIRVKARDVHGAESNWATLKISIPYDKRLNQIEYDSPDDLFNMDMEKNLTLEDLGWHQLYEKTLSNGVVVTVGRWNAGLFETFNSKGEPQTIQLDEKAAIYWPPNYPNTPNSQAGFGHVYAAHLDTNIDKGEPEVLAEVFGIPILQHGESSDDWKELGFKGRDEMINETFKNIIKLNPCEAIDLTRGNFGWVLARTNIRAITLLQRLAEERGGKVTKIALRGGSKEGFATWLASAVDDRIIVDGSGGYHLEDLETSLPFYETDWSCNGTGAGGSDSKDLVLVYHWLTNTSAGNAVLKTHSINCFQEQLKPRFFLIIGDVTRYDMHDGHYYPLGCETSFLENFTSHSWRYDRLPNLERESLSFRGVRLRALLLEQLVNGPDYYSKIYLYSPEIISH